MRKKISQTVADETDYRQIVAVGIAQDHIRTVAKLNGTALSVQYHWVESVGYTLGLQWLLIEAAGGASATDEAATDLCLTAGWLMIDRPSLTLAPEIVIGIWGSGHLTDSIENARAQSSLNGLEVPISIQIDDALRVGAEYTLYDLSVCLYQKVELTSATLAR